MSRIEAAQLAALQFSETLFARDGAGEIALVMFGTDARVLSQFKRAAELDDLRSAIAKLKASGDTNIGAGLLAAESLFAGVRTSVPRSLVIRLLTDGHNTYGPDPLEIAQRLKSAGVHIDAIGFASTEAEVDAHLLRQLASPNSSGSACYQFFDRPDRLALDARRAAGRLTR